MAEKKSAGEVFAKKFNAGRSAVRALWPEAEEGKHYKLIAVDGGWCWKPVGNAARRHLREHKRKALEALRTERARQRAEERERKRVEREREKAAALRAKNEKAAARSRAEESRALSCAAGQGG